MNKENKLVPGLPSGFEDRWGKKILLKKKLLNAIENNFIKFGAEAIETSTFEISRNIGSFLAEDDSNPMSDVFSFQDGDESLTARYDLSSPLARFYAQNNQELPSIFKRYQIQNVFRNEKLEMVVIENLCKLTLILLETLILLKLMQNFVI